MVLMSVWPTDGSDGAVSTELRWRKMGRLWAPSGVAPGQGGQMAPSLAGTNLTVRSGAAWVDGHYCELASDQVLTTTANGLTVVRFDPAANTAELLYRDGISTPTQNPLGVWELPIAQIVGSALTDLRTWADPVSGFRRLGTTLYNSTSTSLGLNASTFTRIPNFGVSFTVSSPTVVQFNAKVVFNYSAVPTVMQMLAQFNENINNQASGAFEYRNVPSIGQVMQLYFTEFATVPPGTWNWYVATRMQNVTPAGLTYTVVPGGWITADRIV
jgi:hypothetical protein